MRVVSHGEVKKSIPLIYAKRIPSHQGGYVYLNLEGYLVKFDRLFSPSYGEKQGAEMIISIRVRNNTTSLARFSAWDRILATRV